MKNAVGKTNKPREASHGIPFRDLPEEVHAAVEEALFSPPEPDEWIDVRSALKKVSAGRKLAVVRELAGLTQKELAREAGINQSEVSRAEKNFGKASWTTIQNIVRVIRSKLAGPIALFVCFFAGRA